MRRSEMLAGVVGAGVAGVAGVAYALVEARWFALRRVTIPVLRPAARRPLRLLHLSDLHLVPGQHAKAAFVRHCADSSPDVIVLTGDTLEHLESVDDALALLAPLAAGRLAFAVLGSHDLYGPRLKNPLHYLTAPQRRLYGQPQDTRRFVAGLSDAGWRVLDNTRTQVESSAGPLDVAGLGDPHIRRDDPSAIDWTAPGDGTALRLGVVHAPYLRALDVFASRGYDLVLSGHTHGGQLRVPGVGALVTNCDLRRGQARGLSRHRSLWLHVSAGLGTSQYTPVRFACRPEASVLDLVTAP